MRVAALLVLEGPGLGVVGRDLWDKEDPSEEPEDDANSSRMASPPQADQ